VVDPPVIATVIDKPVSCIGMSDGQLAATAPGTGGPYSYSWNTTPVQNAQTAE